VRATIEAERARRGFAGTTPIGGMIMALSRLAQQFAAEIRLQDWSDAPYRIDRAGHRREFDTNRGGNVLSDAETEAVRTNVMWVAAQVLGYNDPNFDPFEFAEACGVNTYTRSGRPRSGHITAGLRTQGLAGGAPAYQRPGTYQFDAGAPV
jgi:hypothetical protein